MKLWPPHRNKTKSSVILTITDIQFARNKWPPHKVLCGCFQNNCRFLGLYVFVIVVFSWSFFDALCPFPFRSWYMWAFWQRNLAMCSVQRCWKGDHLGRWFSGPTSSPPFMCWVITSRSHSQLKSCRGESTRIQSNNLHSYWKHASPQMDFECKFQKLNPFSTKA